MTRRLLKGADHILTMAGSEWTEADILIEDGVIQEVGPGLKAEGAEVIGRLQGRLVTPGSGQHPPPPLSDADPRGSRRAGRASLRLAANALSDLVALWSG